MNTQAIEQETLAFVQGKSAEEIRYAISLMRAVQSGREAAASTVKRAPGRPSGSRTKRLGRGVGDLKAESGVERLTQ